MKKNVISSLLIACILITMLIIPMTTSVDASEVRDLYIRTTQTQVFLTPQTGMSIPIQFGGVGIDSIDVTSHGNGIHAYIVRADWKPYPNVCHAEIIVTASHGATTGSINFLLKNNTLGIIMTKTINITTNNTEKERSAWVKTNGSNLNVRNSPNGQIIGSLKNGEGVTVIGEITNGFYKIRWNNMNAYVSVDYISFIKPDDIMSRIIEISKTYKNGDTWTGSEQCKRFAKKIYSLLFGFPLPSTQNSINGNNPAFAYTSNSNLTLVGQINSKNTKVTETNVKNLLSKARSGDVIQCSKEYSSGAHTYIFLSHANDGKGIYIYDANADGKNTIRYNAYVSYDTIASVRKGGVSLYTATNYK